MGSTNVSLDLASQTGEHLHISKMNSSGTQGSSYGGMKEQRVPSSSSGYREEEVFHRVQHDHFKRQFIPSEIQVKEYLEILF